MPTIYDPQTGQPVNVPLDQAASGLVSGQYGLDAGAGPVLLRHANGKVYQFAPNEAADALASKSYSLLSPEEELQARIHHEEAAKGLTGSLEQAGESALNQATFGVSGAIEHRGETPEQEHERELREKEHTAARVLGGALGMGASLLYGGELFKGAASAGEALSRGVIPAAEAANAGLTAKVASTALDYATQGAILSTPQALTQAIIGDDPKRAAETLAWGIGAGAVLGVPAELLSSAGAAAGEKLARTLGEDAAGDRLEQFAAHVTAKTVGAQRHQTNPLGEDWIQEVTDFAHEQGLITGSRQDIGRAIDEAQGRIGGKLRDTINQLDQVVQSGSPEAYDAAQHFLKPGELGDKLWAAFDSPEFHGPLNSDIQSAVKTLVDHANTLPTTLINGREVISFETANQFASQLRRRWAPAVQKAMNEGGLKGPMAVTPLDAAKSLGYYAVTDAVNDAANRVATAAAKPELVGALADAKREYAKIATLDRWAATLEKQASGNRRVTLTDWLAMGHLPFSHLGTMAGAALGPVGSAAGKALGIAADFVAKKWIENQGMVLLSRAAYKASKLGPDVFTSVLASDAAQRLEATMTGVRQTVQRMASQGIEETKAATKEHMKALLGSTSGLTPDQAYAKLHGQLTTLASNPEALARASAAVAAPISAGHPELGQALDQQMRDTIAYLYSALPKPPAPPAPFTPNQYAPTRKELLDFHDKAEVATNPMRIMEHLSRGTLSPAHMDAMQTLYPSVLDYMRGAVDQFHVEHPDVLLPPEHRSAMGRFLGQPLGASAANPDLVQQAYMAAAPQPPQGPTKPRGAPSRFKRTPNAQTEFAATQGPGGLDEQ